MVVPALLALALLQQTSAPEPAREPAPRGQVVFERHESTTEPQNTTNEPQITTESATNIHEIDRKSAEITAYQLDFHLDLATAKSTIRAHLRVRNNAAQPLTRIPLSITSSMHWESFSIVGNGSKHAAFEQHTLPTDADHTGGATEAILTLPTPLAPGETVDLDTFYEGPLSEDTNRLTSIGAPQTQASQSDWDGFNFAAPTSGLRGFGNVLWYPVIAPAMSLGEGNRLFSAIADDRARNASVAFSLRLTVESPVPLTSAFFCGESRPLHHVSEANNDAAATLPATDAPSIYTAEWTRPALGTRTPSLFVTSAPSVISENKLLTAYTLQSDAVATYNAAASAIRPVMEAWLGARPLQTLTMLDLGVRSAVPFQDDAMIVFAVSRWLNGSYPSAYG